MGDFKFFVGETFAEKGQFAKVSPNKWMFWENFQNSINAARAIGNFLNDRRDYRTQNHQKI